MPSGGSRERKSDQLYHDIAADLASGYFPQIEIARYYRVSSTFVSAVSSNLAIYGQPIKPPAAVQGRPRTITYEIEGAIRDLLQTNDTVQLNEIVEHVRNEYGVEMSRSTAHRTLRRLNMKRKRVTEEQLNQTPVLYDDRPQEDRYAQAVAVGANTNGRTKSRK